MKGRILNNHGRFLKLPQKTEQVFVNKETVDKIGNRNMRRLFKKANRKKEIYENKKGASDKPD